MIRQPHRSCRTDTLLSHATLVLTTGAKLCIYPILFRAAARSFLLPVFDVTHALVGDWYNHAVSVAAFLYGFLMLKHGSVAAECIRLRWPALALFLVSYGAYAAYYWIYAVDDVSAPEWLRNAVRVVHAIEQWSAIVAVDRKSTRLNSSH